MDNNMVNINVAVECLVGHPHICMLTFVLPKENVPDPYEFFEYLVKIAEDADLLFSIDPINPLNAFAAIVNRYAKERNGTVLIMHGAMKVCIDDKTSLDQEFSGEEDIDFEDI